MTTSPQERREALDGFRNSLLSLYQQVHRDSVALRAMRQALEGLPELPEFQDRYRECLAEETRRSQQQLGDQVAAVSELFRKSIG
jgi:hypothetical protein